MKLQSLISPLACLSAFVLLGAPESKAGDDCKDVSGPFSSVLVQGPGCESPIGICTHGLLTGNFHATYDFTMITFEPDPNDPTKMIYSGISVIMLRSGKQMFSIDTGIMDTSDPTAVPFVTTANIQSGTGQYDSGTIVASGLLNFITGEAIGSYVGEVCKLKGAD